MSPLPPSDAQAADLVLIGLNGLPPHGDPGPGDVPWALVPLPVPALPAHAGGGMALWRARVEALMARPALWQHAEHVLWLDDDVEISATGVTELFRLMRLHRLAVAQPSLAWRSHFCDAATLHNPSFMLRHVNRVDPAALAFSQAALRQFLPLLAAVPDPACLARLVPACQPDPLHGAAVVDAVQCQRTRAPADSEMADTPPWPPSLAGAGPHTEAAYTWGGLGQRGQRVGLFDPTREELLGLLTAGYACAVQEPAVLGEVFLQHFLRSLEAAPLPMSFQGPGGQARPLRRSPIVVSPQP